MTTPKGNCLAGGTSIVESGVRRSSAITPNETDDGSFIRKVTICKANPKVNFSGDKNDRYSQEAEQKR